MKAMSAIIDPGSEPNGISQFRCSTPSPFNAATSAARRCS